MFASICSYTLRQLELGVRHVLLYECCIESSFQEARWNAGSSGDEPELLRKAVTSALQAAVDEKLPTLALPLISSGNFRCRVEKAALIAVAAVFDFLQQMDAGLQQCLQARHQSVLMHLARIPTHLLATGSILLCR